MTVATQFDEVILKKKGQHKRAGVIYCVPNAGSMEQIVHSAYRLHRGLEIKK